MAVEAERRHLLIGDGDAGGIAATIDFRSDAQSGSAVRRGNQADDRGQTDERGAAPVHGTSANPVGTLLGIQRAIAEVNPQIVVTSTTTMDGMLKDLRANERFRATLSACFGAIALLLSTVGLYGVAARQVRIPVHREHSF